MHWAGGLRHIWAATGYSIAGLRSAWHGEVAFRQEVIASLIVIPLALYWADSGPRAALLIGSWTLVLIVELLNSAIESAIDRFGPERHPLAKRAKDISSAAVMVALVNAVVIWALVLLA